MDYTIKEGIHGHFSLVLTALFTFWSLPLWIHCCYVNNRIISLARESSSSLHIHTMLHTSFASAAPRGMPFSQMVNRKFGAFIVKPSSNFYTNCLTTPSLATHLISFFLTFVLVSSAIIINQLPPHCSSQCRLASFNHLFFPAAASFPLKLRSSNSFWSIVCSIFSSFLPLGAQCSCWSMTLWSDNVGNCSQPY